MSKKPLTAKKRRFIDDMASLLMPWGMPQVAARLYGYLLLSAAPLSLDQIATDLEVSKSSVSVAARLLEKHSLARRHGERGSKRVFYEASDTYAGILLEQSSLLAALGKLLQTHAPAVASGIARRRLEEVAKFYLSIREAIESSVRELTSTAGGDTTPVRARGAAQELASVRIRAGSSKRSA